METQFELRSQAGGKTTVVSVLVDAMDAPTELFIRQRLTQAFHNKIGATTEQHRLLKELVLTYQQLWKALTLPR